MRKLVLAIALLLAPIARADFKPSLFYDGTPGRFRLGLLSNSATTNRFMLYTPTQAGNAPWACGFGAAANPVGSRKDHTWSCGWNLAEGGGAIDGTYAVGGFVIEQHWNAAGDPVLEHYWAWNPPGGSQRRPIFFIGQDAAPHASTLALYANSLYLGSGNDTNSPALIALNSASALMRAPSGYPRLLVDDSDSTVSIRNGDAGNNNRGSVLINSAGTVDITGSGLSHLASSSGNNLTWYSGGTYLHNPAGSASEYVQVDGNGVYLAAGGGLKFFVFPSANYTAQVLRPNVDKSTAVTLGTSGGRFGSVAAALASATWTGLACTADEEGTYTTVVKGAGQASCLALCLKNSSDAYVKAEVFCAP